MKTRKGTWLLHAALLLVAGSLTAHAQPWWNPDYTRRIPVTITNTDVAATPTPASAEITLSPIPAEIRSDWTDLRVAHWNGSSWTDLDRQVLLDVAPDATATPPVDGKLRVVFRLAAPITAGASDTGYYLYYGNISPTRPAQDTYKIYDSVVDFNAFDVDAEPYTWGIFTNPDNGSPSYKITVKNYAGKKEGYFEPQYHHPRAWVAKDQMPAFKNVETYTRVTPANASSGEIWTCARVVADPLDANYGGSYALGLDAYGSQISLLRWGPDGAMKEVKTGGEYHAQTNVTENMVLRVGDTMSGKVWKDGAAQAPWFFKDLDYSAAGPVYDQPGTVGMANYSSQNFYLEFIAARELLPLTIANSPAETAPASTSRIAGTVTSTKYGAMKDFPVVISNGTTSTTVYTDQSGKYQLSLPAGSYTVTATAQYHTTVTLTGVAPSASAMTNINLVYTAVTISGKALDKWFRTPIYPGRVIITDANANYLTETTTTSTGAYSIMLQTGGTYSVTLLAQKANGDYNSTGDRKTITGADGADVTVNLNADVVVNGDFETPDGVGAVKPAGHGYSFETPGAYVYTRDKNHTPGGHWSVGITDTSNTTAWNPILNGNNANYNLPVKGNAFDVVVSVWVYFEKPGQYATLRMRNNWKNGGDVPRVAAVAGRVPGTPGYKAAADTAQNSTDAEPMKNTPTFELNNENKGGLDAEGKVPVGQWYQLVTSRPAGDGLSTNDLGLNLYGQKTYELKPDGTPDTTKPVGGTIYFDDLQISIVPHYMVIGKVVDKHGNPLTDSWSGTLSNGGTAGAPQTMLDSVSRVSDTAEFRFYPPTSAPTLVAAVTRMSFPDANKVPTYDNLVDAKSVTPVAYDPNATTPTVTLVGNKKAGVVSGNDMGTTAQSYTWGTDNLKYIRVDNYNPGVPGSGRQPSFAFDNNFFAYYATGGNQGNAATTNIRVNFLDIDLGGQYDIDQINMFYEPWPTNTMKVWITNTPLDDSSYPPVFPPDSDLVYSCTGSNNGRGIVGYGTPWGFTSTSNLYQMIRLPQSKKGQYIRIWTNDTPWPDGHMGFREIRVLSAAAAPQVPYIADDLTRMMQIIAGVEVGMEADLAMFDTNGDHVIDLKDAVSIAKTVANW